MRQGPVRVHSVVLPDPGDVQLRHEQSGEMRMLQGMRGVPGRQVRSVQRLRGLVVGSVINKYGKFIFSLIFFIL